jgi:hypothetical protein
VPIDIRRRLYQASVVNIALCRSGSWALKQENRKKELEMFRQAGRKQQTKVCHAYNISTLKKLDFEEEEKGQLREWMTGVAREREISMGTES